MEIVHERAKTSSLEPTKIRFSIRFKLLTIISLLIVVSLTSMVFLASNYFSNHSQTLIQEFNLSLSRMIGNQTNSNMIKVKTETNLVSKLILQNYNHYTKLNLANSFFQNNNDFIELSILKKSQGSFKPVFFAKNKKFISQTKDSFLNQVNKDSNDFYNRVLNGSDEVKAGPTQLDFTSMIWGFSLSENSNHIVLVLTTASQLMEAFESTGQSEIFTLFLMNSRGQLIAQSLNKASLNLKKSNLLDIPIVKKALASKIDNQSTQYKYIEKNFLGSYQKIKTGNLTIISTVEATKAFEAVGIIQSQNIKITIIVVLLAFLIIFLYSKSLTIPIIQLVEATKDVEKRNYDFNITVKTNDEIGVLTRSFSRMTKGLAEREKLKQTFGKFVNEKLVAKMLNEELKLGGELRRCTILFSDLRNFTKMSENHNPEDVLSLLNRYFTSMVECVHHTDGVVDKFIGDAIMAHWGALSTTNSDVEAAVESALAMRHALKLFNKIVSRQNIPKVQFGVGINTGEVIAGQIGSEKRLEYTVIGDAVNLASRIEYLNKHFGTDILISHSCYLQVKNIYNLAKTPPVKIKGKINPETVYAVLGRKDNPKCLKTISELRNFIGIEFDMEKANITLKLKNGKKLFEEL